MRYQDVPIVFLNPCDGLVKLKEGVTKIFGFPDENGLIMFLRENNTFSTIKAINPDVEDILVDNYVIDFTVDSYNSDTFSYLRFDNSLHICNKHDIMCTTYNTVDMKLFFAKGYVNTANAIFLPSLDVEISYFEDNGLNITQVVDFQDGFLMISNGKVYGYGIESSSHFPQHCMDYSIPCELDYGVYAGEHYIDSIFVSSMRSTVFLDNQSGEMFHLDEYLLLTKSVHDIQSPIRNLFREGISHFTIAIHDNGNVTSLGIYEKEDGLWLHLESSIAEFRRANLEFSRRLSFFHQGSKGFIASTDQQDNLISGVNGEIVSEVATECVSGQIIDGITVITTKSAYNGCYHYIEIEEGEIEKNVILKYDHSCYHFIKTKSNRLIFVTESDILITTLIKYYNDYYIDDIYGSHSSVVVKIKELEEDFYFGIGSNAAYIFGQSMTNELLYPSISLGSENTPTFYNNLMRIDFDSIDVNDIDFIRLGGQTIMLVLTKDKKLYGRGDNSRNMIDDTLESIYYKFTTVDGIFGDKEVCNAIVDDRSPLLIETCDQKVYQQGFGQSHYLGFGADGRIRKKAGMGLNSKEIPYLANKRLQHISSLYIRTMLVVYIGLDCIEGICVIDDDKHIIGDVIHLNNSETIISSNVTITNGTVIITYNSGDANVPIIIDGGQLTLDSTNITLNIDYQDIFDTIQDGTSIIIVDTKDGGVIDGSFENIDLRFSNVDDECKEVAGELVQTEKQVSIVFKVKDNCATGFPIWAIVIIVLGCIILITVVILLVYFLVIKKRIYKSRKVSRGTSTQMDTETNSGKNGMYSGKTYKNPVFN